MPLPNLPPRELAARYAAQAHNAERDKRRAFLLGAVLCLAWATLGVLCIMWSVHSRHEVWREVAFWGGLGIGNGGVIFTLLYIYKRGEERGDW